MPQKTSKIYIDFQGGSHGNYLEFVCNRFLARIPTASHTPFNTLGASHVKQYLSDPIFSAGHFTLLGKILQDSQVISVQIDHQDLLPLQCVSLLRAGDRDIRPDELHIDTYHKLNNPDYRWVLDNLLKAFFSEQSVIDAYNAIADPSWPALHCRDQYMELPNRIRRECETVHGFEIPRLDMNHPHCPRHILKEFFRHGFLDPGNHGFIKVQNQQAHENCVLYHFPYSAFYDTERFVSVLADMAQWAGMEFDCNDDALLELHREFLSRQPYKNTKLECDQLVAILLDDPAHVLPPLDVIQEAYIEAMIQQARNS